jgi:luciferase family oxidoreductase group 1
LKYFSVLDLVPICEGSSARDALRNSIELAQRAERWGYHRYWLAEHHNMPGIGSAATSVVISAIAGATSAMRVGSGGVMLPNSLGRSRRSSPEESIWVWAGHPEPT